MVGSAEGREEVVAHQLTAQTASGDKQKYTHARMHGHRDCLHHIIILMSILCAHTDTHKHTTQACKSHSHTVLVDAQMSCRVQ